MEKPMRPVFQPDNKGCFAACCATLFGGTYEEWECVAHHNPDWREQLYLKTGYDYLEIGVKDISSFNIAPGIFILGVDIKENGIGHVVLGEYRGVETGANVEFHIIHDPLGFIRPPYNIGSIIVLHRRFPIP